MPLPTLEELKAEKAALHNADAVKLDFYIGI